MSALKTCDDLADGKPPHSDSPSESTEWSAVGPERGYYRRDNAFIKRSIRPSEYITNAKGIVHFPRLGKEKLQNEAASLRFIRHATNIPVPIVYGAFEMDGSYILIMEHIEGVSMKVLPEDQKKVVRAEIEQHLATLQGLKSRRLGGPSGIVLPPWRAFDCTERDIWSLRSSESDEYVFCHNDLTHHNIIVDPISLKINAIIDWEFAGSIRITSKGIFTSGLGLRLLRQWH